MGAMDFVSILLSFFFLPEKSDFSFPHLGHLTAVEAKHIGSSIWVYCVFV